jgi:hypothetical protein
MAGNGLWKALNNNNTKNNKKILIKGIARYLK